MRNLQKNLNIIWQPPISRQTPPFGLTPHPPPMIWFTGLYGLVQQLHLGPNQLLETFKSLEIQLLSLQFFF